MPQELPAVACRLLKESAEVPLADLTHAAQAVSGKTLGSRWTSREACPCALPAGTYLQAAYPELRQVHLDSPEGLIAGLGYALTRPGHTFQFHQANTAEERSGLAGVHQWSIMLPTSARVAQEVYEPLIGIHYPMLCTVKNYNWQIGTVSIRAEDYLATGFRFVNWVHEGSSTESRAVPPPAATSAAYQTIEQWLPMTEDDTDNILVLTTRTNSAQNLQGFFQQSKRRANAETAVKVAGATSKHCIVLHGRSTFLSGTSSSTDADHECYTRANVAYSRATDLTISACPVNMHGTTGITQVISALLHGTCTLHTDDQQTVRVWVDGNFSTRKHWVSESTATFLTAMEPQQLWTGPLPVCLVEYHQGCSRRLRLVLASQSLLTDGEMALLDGQHPVHWKVHKSGLLFPYAADRRTDPDWFVIPDGQQPDAWRLLHAAHKGGGRFCVGAGLRYAQGQAKDAANKAKEYQFESLHKIYYYDAWRWIIELDQDNSPLRLPPRPGLLQNGCYWPQLYPELADTTPMQTVQAGVVAEVSLSLSSTSPEGSEEAESPSEVPAPDSQSPRESSPASPIIVGSSEEEPNGQSEQEEPQSQDTEQEEEPTSIDPITSANEAANAQGATHDDPPLAETPRAKEHSEQPGAEQATESESSTSDAVIEIDVDEEAAPSHATHPPKGTRKSPLAQDAPCMPPRGGVCTIATPSPSGTPTDTEKTGMKRPASLASLRDEGQRRAPPSSSVASSSEVKSEGGHPRGCPSASPASDTVSDLPVGKAQRRSRWAADTPTVTALPPQGVDRTSDTSLSPEQATTKAAEAPSSTAASRPRSQGPLAVKSKAVKPANSQSQENMGQGLANAIHSRLKTPAATARGLLGFATDQLPLAAAANPQMPSTPATGPGSQPSGSSVAVTKEINLRAAEETDPVDTDIVQLAEQRAMHTVYRYQVLSVEAEAKTQAKPTGRSDVPPPAAPPVSVYANLPKEWPLARLCLQLRHIGVLLRVTLYRRAAELSFRGVDFRQLPREVMKYIQQDFTNVGGEVARRLARLFDFLKPDSQGAKDADPLGLALYADPAYWLYGLLSFCAKACELKTAEAQEVPTLDARDEQDLPLLDATAKTLSLMQTVIMSFGRKQSLGRPDLPIHHLHVYFPVQLVHKLVARMNSLRFVEVMPKDGKKYKQNQESVTNSPYIVVGTFEALCRSSSYAPLPHTPKFAGLYRCGLLDVNLGQQTSFQSSYKNTLRIEVPVWPDTLQALLPITKKAAGVEATEEGEEEEEEEMYVPPEGQGCFSFRQSLLLRARDTYAAKSSGNKYEIISQWLLTGLAMVLSKPNWKFLAKRGTLTSTPQTRLREYYHSGYPPGTTDNTMQPYGHQRPNAVPGDQWQSTVEWYTHSRYLRRIETVSRDKGTCSLADFYNTMDRRNPILALTDGTTPHRAHSNPTEDTANTTQTHPTGRRPPWPDAQPECTEQTEEQVGSKSSAASASSSRERRN